MPVVGASIRPAVGGCGHRISEKFGDLSKPLLFVFRELQDVLLREFGDLIWRVQRQIYAGTKTPGGAASLSFCEALDDILI
jgi:hypothetical protein